MVHVRAGSRTVGLCEEVKPIAAERLSAISVFGSLGSMGDMAQEEAVLCRVGSLQRRTGGGAWEGGLGPEACVRAGR